MSTRCTTHFHACDCREERFEELQAQLDEAVKVVEFYAEEFEYINHFTEGLLVRKEASLVKFEPLSKRAREFLAKIEKEKEDT